MASEVCHDTNDCIVTGGADLMSRQSAPGALIQSTTPCDMVQERCDTCGSARDTPRGRGLCCDTKFVT